jgi:ubiquinone/menaquinone biosynthesis C-methylase UbiE
MWVRSLEVKKFFELYWKQKKLRWFDQYYDFLDTINQDVFNRLSLSQKRRILLVGIGETDDVVFFKETGSEIVSIDIARNILKWGDFFMSVQMDANKLAFKKKSFDIVFLRTVLLHCDHSALLREVRRVLREGGRFFWIEPLKNNFLLWVYRLLLSPGKMTRLNYLTYEDLRSFDRTFHTVWHRECYLFSVVLIPVFLFIPWLRKPVRLLQGFEMKIVDRVHFLRRFCWISYGYAEV